MNDYDYNDLCFCIVGLLLCGLYVAIILTV